MRARYGCVCFALPRNLVAHLAARSSPEHAALLNAQLAHSAQLRGARAAHPAGVAQAAGGTQALHRQAFSAQGKTALPGKLLRGESDAPSADADADAAFDNIGIVLQFYRDVLGRMSVDGRGARIDTSVHYGARFANAMWTGNQMIVGDGDGQHVEGLARSLGIIAHELSHGVTQHLVKGGLGVVLRPKALPTLEGEAGALNESFCDVFASMVKQWHLKQDVGHADWLLGEDILAPGSGHAVRSLKDPGNAHLTWPEDDQLKDARRWMPGDDPHKASGIPNHAFYLAAMALGGHSWEKLAPIWLEAFGRLSADATFADAAHATVDVAAARHGKASAEHEAVHGGWKKVYVLA